MTAIYELTRWHERAGGTAQIVVGRGTRHDYEVGECVEVGLHGLPVRRERALDAALGALGLARRFAEAAYRPALEGVPRTFDGPLLVHNNPGPLQMLARSRPAARPVLYAQNALFRTYGRREVRRTVDSVTTLVFVSEYLAEAFLGRFGIGEAKIAIIRNGVDAERFFPGDATQLDPPVVLFVGRVIPDKGPDLLLRAARKLVNGRREFRVRIVGNSGFSATDPLTSYERHLREIAEPLGDVVEFQPFVDRSRVVDEYRSASIFCAPSNWDDPCPLTVLEGLACGLPTVTTRRGGIPEIGGDAAMYFNPPSVDGLAERLAHLLDDPAARVDWGRRARERALSLSWERQYTRLREALAA